MKPKPLVKCSFRTVLIRRAVTSLLCELGKQEIALFAELLVKGLKMDIFYQNLDRNVFTHVTDI